MVLYEFRKHIQSVDATMGLRRYQAKRSFSHTPEPTGEKSARTAALREPKFVIQKHAARRLHYDFRLEMDGVLKSWAVPKGIPCEKGGKRLAMEVEDHPLEYREFEGTIPSGNYGAGTVMVWDTGTYRVLEEEPLSALKKGKIVFQLAGKKLKGQWTLVRMRGGESGKQPWLLIKTGEDMKPVSAKADDRSAVTQRSMKQIAADADATWESDRPARRGTPRSRPAPKPGTASRLKLDSELKKLRASEPRFVPPMKTQLASALPEEGDWVFEVKLDGIRALAVKNDREVRLFSRRPRELTTAYPAIAEAVRNLAARQLVVDGEIVALSEKGHPSFQLLQNAKRAGRSAPPIFYYVFDLLHLEGRDVTGLSLMRRKEILRSLLTEDDGPIRFSATLEARPDILWAQVEKLGLEGIIAKQRHSKYEPGRRSAAWLKIKRVNEQEFVIGGYTAPGGSRKFFGAILVGYYDHKKLLFAGKVGTGFDWRSLEALYQQFQQLRAPKCPFANLPVASGRSGITAAEMRKCAWVKPELVCQIKFAEWTDEGLLRQPVFVGLREDKRPAEVAREPAVA